MIHPRDRYLSLIHSFDQVNKKNEDEIAEVCQKALNWLSDIKEADFEGKQDMIIHIDQKLYTLQTYAAKNNAVKKSHDTYLEAILGKKPLSRPLNLAKERKACENLLSDLSIKFLFDYESDDSIMVYAVSKSSTIRIKLPLQEKNKIPINDLPPNLRDEIINRLDNEILSDYFKDWNLLISKLISNKINKPLLNMIDRSFMIDFITMAATTSDNQEVLLKLIENGAPFKSETFVSFCRLGNEEMVKKHIKAGLDVNKGEYYTQPPLIEAVKSDQTAIVKLLIKEGASIDIKNGSGVTPLHAAAENGNIELINMFSSIDVNAKDDTDETALIYAARNQHADAVLKLLELGANPKARSMIGKNLFHLIHNRKIFKKIKDNVDINQSDNNQFSPVYYCYDVDSFKLMIEFGADLSLSQYNQSLLYWWILQEMPDDLIQALLDQGIEINPTKPLMKSPLNAAITNGNVKLFHKLIREYGAKVNLENSKTTPPLIQAILHRQDAIFEALLDMGAEINPPEDIKMTPLKAAIQCGDVEKMQKLILLGAEINRSGGDEFSPLIHAIRSKRIDMIQDLWLMGADFNAPKIHPLISSIQHYPHAAKFILKVKSPPLDETYRGRSCYQIANEYMQQRSGNYSLFLPKLLYDNGLTLKEEDIKANKGFTFLYLDLMQKGEIEKAEWLDQVTEGKLSENAERLMLAHRFAVKGKGKDYFNYEGFFPDFTFPELAASFREFANIPGNVDLDQETIDEIVETLSLVNNEVTDKDLYNRHLEGKTVIIPTGWEAHSTAIVIDKVTFVYCNKGSGRTDHTISFFKNISIESLPQDFLTKSMYTQNHLCHSEVPPFANKYKFNTLLKKELGIDIDKPDLDKSFTTHEQKTGNCTWASAKLALRALLFLKYQKFYPELSTEEVKIKVNEVFKKWRLFDLERGLKHYHNLHAKEGKKDSDFDKELLDMIHKKIEDHVIDGKEGYRVLYDLNKAFLNLPSSSKKY